jgi:hypothetical protein
MEALLYIGIFGIIGGLFYLGAELGKARNSLFSLETEVSQIGQDLTRLADMVRNVQDSLEKEA